jgi:hypothetical protein
VVEFLSDAWIAGLDRAARAAPELAVDAPFSVATLVQGAAGDCGYTVRFAAEGATVTAVTAATSSGRDTDPAADVVLVTDPATAWALHEGSLRAQDAFARGLLKVRGRAELLAAHEASLVALARALAPLRDDTTPPESVHAGR